MSEWIKVQDSLPPSEDGEDGYDVLTCNQYFKMRVSFFDVEGRNFPKDEDTTHWMYLPNPPKEN